VSLLPIVKMGEPVLRKKTVPVTAFDEALRQILEDMFQTMYDRESNALLTGAAHEEC